MTCAMCGRRLRSETSRQLGYGPVCYKKMFGTSARIRADNGRNTVSSEEEEYIIPGQMTLEDFIDSEAK